MTVKGSAGSDLLLVVGIMIGLGIAWYFAGGPNNILSHTGPFLNAPTVYSPGGTYSVPSVSINYASSSPSSGSNNGILSTFTNYLGTFSETASPYTPYIRLERANAGSAAPNNEYVTLRVSANASQKITVTGWRIESTVTTLGTTLPQATTLPFLGEVNSAGPVSLSPGDVVYIVTGRSPMGTSFRTNMCTGYFEQYQNFSPSLPLDCPSPDDEASRVLHTGNYTDQCKDVVDSIDRCDMYTGSISGTAGSQCESFINSTLTYNGCIQAHKSDPKFNGTTWYLFLNRDQSLWKSRDERIRIVDETGKVVAAVAY